MSVSQSIFLHVAAAHSIFVYFHMNTNQAYLPSLLFLILMSKTLKHSHMQSTDLYKLWFEIFLRNSLKWAILNNLF
jgi:hypothetical protein